MKQATFCLMLMIATPVFARSGGAENTRNDLRAINGLWKVVAGGTSLIHVGDVVAIKLDAKAGTFSVVDPNNPIKSTFLRDQCQSIDGGAYMDGTWTDLHERYPEFTRATTTRNSLTIKQLFGDANLINQGVDDDPHFVTSYQMNGAKLTVKDTIYWVDHKPTTSKTTLMRFDEKSAE